MKFYSSVIFFVIFTKSLSGQFSIGFNLGLGQSDFNLSRIGAYTTQASYIPLGAQVYYGDRLQFGISGTHAFLPFTFSMQSGGEILAKETIDQTTASLLCRYHFFPDDVSFFIQAGVGLYFGNRAVELGIEYQDLLGEELARRTIRYSPSPGFQAGGGIRVYLSQSAAIVPEFVYHFIERQPKNSANIQSLNTNNWALHVGFLFDL